MSAPRKPSAAKPSAAKPAAKKPAARKSASTRKRAPTAPTSVRSAVKRELEGMPPDVGGCAIAASAMVLAAELDKPRNSATSKSMCAARLAEAMEKLRAMVPPKRSETKLDEIAKRREQRLAGRAAS